MRVLLVDDNRLMLEGLQNMLDAYGVQVSGLAKDGQEAVALARKIKPDVILMDIRMPGCDGLAATRLIKAEMPATKIVVLTTSAEDEDLFEAVKSGAYGYLLKSVGAEELVEALGQAEHGIPPFSPGLATKLLREFARLGQPSGAISMAIQAKSGNVSPANGLTPRQVEVLSLVSQGMSYKEAGVRLALSPRTIKYHMAEIINQLHLENRSQAVAYAGSLGLRGNIQGKQ